MWLHREGGGGGNGKDNDVYTYRRWFETQESDTNDKRYKTIKTNDQHQHHVTVG